MPHPCPEPVRQHFRHCPGCGAPLPPAAEPRLLHCGRCGFHYHFNPAIGTGAILVAPDGRILLTRRLHDPGRGKLGLPGGFADAGETAEEALRREVREEVGLEVADLAYLCSGVNWYPYRGITYPVLDLFFVARLPAALEARALDEVASCAWLRPAEIDFAAIAFPTVRAALERFLAHP
jgi:ADP-ribose pyrophosphatase YjhB (NUDIX family)